MWLRVNGSLVLGFVEAAGVDETCCWMSELGCPVEIPEGARVIVPGHELTFSAIWRGLGDDLEERAAEQDRSGDREIVFCWECGKTLIVRGSVVPRDLRMNELATAWGHLWSERAKAA